VVDDPEQGQVSLIAVAQYSRSLGVLEWTLNGYKITLGDASCFKVAVSNRWHSPILISHLSLFEPSNALKRAFKMYGRVGHTLKRKTHDEYQCESQSF